MVEFIGLSFPFSSKLKIWSFYVVVVQGRQRNVQKKRETHADLLFCSLTLLRFWRSCCLRSRSFETSLTFLRRSETAPRRSRKWTLMRSVADVNKQERGLEPTKTEVNFQEWELEFSAPNFHGNRAGTTFGVNDLCRTGPSLFMLYRIPFLWRHEKISDIVRT